MTIAEISTLIAAGGFVLSVMVSVFISGVFKGRTETRLAMLEANQDRLATKEQLAGVKEDLAEIKGMFRMTLRTESERGG
jgi:hypothetical protein